MTEKQFDAIAYFKQLTEENVTCRLYNFVATTCSGPDTVQGVMQQFRRTANFVIVSDTVDSNTHSYKQDDMADREEKLNVCRYIFRQFLSRLLHDKEMEIYDDQMEFLDLTHVYSTELGRWSMNGVTGLYFMVTSDEPVDLQYDESLWQKQ